jgi:hypothetical protein
MLESLVRHNLIPTYKKPFLQPKRNRYVDENDIPVRNRPSYVRNELTNLSKSLLNSKANSIVLTD